MTATDRETLRHTILSAAEAAKPYGVTLALLSVAVRNIGLRSATTGDIHAEVDYLADKGFLHPEPKALSPENKSWRISASGRDYLAQEGIA
jgi:hypothetical protein